MPKVPDLTLCAAQAAFGRVFSGYAFIADPPEVVFKDCVPGQTYKTTVQLINRSFTGSSIRLLEVPTEVRVGSCCTRALSMRVQHASTAAARQIQAAAPCYLSVQEADSLLRCDVHAGDARA